MILEKCLQISHNDKSALCEELSRLEETKHGLELDLGQAMKESDALKAKMAETAAEAEQFKKRYSI